jgi:hypothetical protein
MTLCPRCFAACAAAVESAFEIARKRDLKPSLD